MRESEGGVELRKRKGNRWNCSLRTGATVMLLVVAAVGCSGKEEQAVYRQFQKHKNEIVQMQETERLIFKEGEGNETILIVRYLPRESKTEERFLVMGTPATVVDMKTLALSRAGGKKPLKIARISSQDLPEDLRGIVPGWFVDYRLFYPKNSRNKFPVDFTVKGETKTLFFYKGPKYLIDRKSSVFK